jgi:hypothetical protein
VPAHAPFAPMPIEKELVAEKASSLARSAAQLEAALAALAEAERSPVGAPAAARAEAARRLWYLVVQREAIGLRNHEDLFRLYRIPPALRLYAGPRRAR